MHFEHKPFLSEKESFAAKLVASNRVRKNEAQIRLIALIDELAAKEVPTSFNNLLPYLKNLKAHLEFYLNDLESEGYIEETSAEDDTSGYFRLVFRVTEAGRLAYETYVRDVSHFLTRLMDMNEKGTNEELFHLLEDNRDLLWFAYYKGMINKQSIEDVARRLDVSLGQIWWGDGTEIRGYS